MGFSTTETIYFEVITPIDGHPMKPVFSVDGYHPRPCCPTRANVGFGNCLGLSLEGLKAAEGRWHSMARKWINGSILMLLFHPWIQMAFGIECILEMDENVEKAMDRVFVSHFDLMLSY